MRKPIRILHGPTNVGNQPWVISRAERAFGHKSDLVVNYGTAFNYPADATLTPYAQDTRLNRLRRKFFALTVPLRYDVIHLYFGRNFLLWDDFGFQFGRGEKKDREILQDILLAKRLGRRVVITLQGCDVRQAGRSNAINEVTMCRPDGCPAYAACLDHIDGMRTNMIDKLLPLADRVFYLNPELGRFVSGGEFLPYGNVDIDAVIPEQTRQSGKLRILHAPSNNGIKGTSRILNALDALRAKFDFELILVENTPHDEAMKLYRSADLAIDQILAGWYGGFAVELMAMGKPVAAYIREEDREFVPPQMWSEIPVVRLHERSLETDLARVLADPQSLQLRGTASRRYVERWHRPSTIAAALLRVYRNADAPLTLDSDESRKGC